MDLFRTTFAKQTQLYVHMTIWSAKKWFGLETEFGHPILLSKCSCRPALTSHFSAPHTRQQTSSNGCFRYESKNTFTYSHHVYIVQYIWYGTEWVTTVSFHFISTTQAIFFSSCYLSTFTSFIPLADTFIQSDLQLRWDTTEWLMIKGLA